MSYIHELAKQLVESGEYAPKDFAHAKRVAALSLAKQAVQQADKPVDSDSIWEAVAVCGYDRMTRKAVSAVLTEYALLNGYSCPRAFDQGLEAFNTL